MAAAIWPILAGAFVATAALAHYDALFFLPPIAIVVLWRTGLARPAPGATCSRRGCRGAALGLVVLALFFAPYLDNPLFALATDRIGDRSGRLPAQQPSVDRGISHALPRDSVPAAGGALIVRRPRRRHDSSRRTDTPTGRVWLLGLLWAAVPLLFYAFVARKPGTHVHVATNGLVLLAGAGFAALWAALGARLPGRVSRRRAGGGVRGALGLVGAYLVPIYLQSAPRDRPREPRAEPAAVLAPPGGLPTKERFGFPYQAGWKAIGALFADGTLQGSYESNEQPQVTYWYTRGAWRCSADPATT